MDIKCCGCWDVSSWTEAVLFVPDKDGGLHEVACTDVRDSYAGVWELEHNGNTYVVDVVDGGGIEAPSLAIISPEHLISRDAAATGWTVDKPMEPASEPKWHGIVRWCNADVIAAAQTNGWDMTEEEADAWWSENESSFKSMLTEHGNEMLAIMTAGHVEGDAPDPADTIKQALEKQNTYIAASGGVLGLQESDEQYNDTNRALIQAAKAQHGQAFLGSFNYHGDRRIAVVEGRKSPLWEYTGQKLYNFCADFVVPCKDEQLAELIRRWNSEGDARLVSKISNLVEQLGGFTLLWR